MHDHEVNDYPAPLDWALQPVSDDAWFDAVRLRVVGDVEWDGNMSFSDYVALIAGGELLSAAGTEGRRYRTSLRALETLSGEFALDMASPGRADAQMPGTAKFQFTLYVNPTKTRALAMRRLGCDLENVYSRQFFGPLPTVAEVFDVGHRAGVEVAFNKAENMLVGLDQLGGSTVEARREVRDQYLLVFEDHLKRMVMDALAPPHLDRQVSLEGCRADVGSRLRVSLEWHKLTVQRAEVYWERACEDPLGLITRVASRGQELARRISVGLYDTPHWEVRRTEVASSIHVPLTGTRNIGLALYAKSRKRVRFEVRYQKDFARHLFGVTGLNTGRLTALLARLADNAAKRLQLPWVAFADVATVPQEAELSDLPVLIAALVAASRFDHALMGPIVHGLLLTGGITADEDSLPGVSKALRKLERLGIVARSPMQLKEAKAGRRYALTPRFGSARRKMLRGFSPEENIPMDPVDPYIPYPGDECEGDVVATNVATMPPHWNRHRR